MPGPKMGPRPADFDEQVIRQSPTFAKWTRLGVGEKLRYACREFVKGHGDDEERLMRRIMIARRNNLRDHETLKRARHRLQQRENSQDQGSKSIESDQSASTNGGLQHSTAGAQLDPSSTSMNAAGAAGSTGVDGHGSHTSNPRKRRPAALVNDDQVQNEMDVQAVEATRSYRTWMALANGNVFVYNQKYIKGREGHDWLLRKNIWRRMRYRRENKKMVEKMKQQSTIYNAPPAFQSSRSAGTSTILDGNGIVSANLGNSSSMVEDATRNPPNKTAAMTNPRSAEVSMVSHIVDQSLLASRTHHANVPSTHSSDHDLHSASIKQDPDRAATLLPSPPPVFPEATPATGAEAIDATAVMAAVAAASSATTHDLETAAAVEAACAVAESYAKTTQNGASSTANNAHAAVRNPLEAAASTANPAALDAAARLAAATASAEKGAIV